MFQLNRWFKKHEKELYDDVDLHGSGWTRPTLAQCTILKSIGSRLLDLSSDKDKRGSATDLVRVKWELTSNNDEHF